MTYKVINDAGEYDWTLFEGNDYEEAYREFGKFCTKFPERTIHLYEDGNMIKEYYPENRYL